MLQHITANHITSWERFYRSNFINSLTGYKSVSLAGTADENGNPNLAIFSSIIHLGSNPALVGFINRPLEASHHTLDNIRATGAYTINHIHPAIVEAAHQTSAKYAAGVSEFAAVGLTPLFTAGCRAPFVLESRVKYALRLEEIIPIAINRTFLVIGSITDILAGSELVQADGFLKLEAAETVASLGADGYYLPELLTRLAYAKTDQPVRPVSGTNADE